MGYQQLQGNRAYMLPSSATFSITNYNPISGINQPSMTSTNIGYVSYMAITQTAGALQTSSTGWICGDAWASRRHGLSARRPIASARAFVSRRLPGNGTYLATGGARV